MIGHTLHSLFIHLPYQHTLLTGHTLLHEAARVCAQYPHLLEELLQGGVGPQRGWQDGGSGSEWRGSSGVDGRGSGSGSGRGVGSSLGGNVRGGGGSGGGRSGGGGSGGGRGAGGGGSGGSGGSGGAFTVSRAGETPLALVLRAGQLNLAMKMIRGAVAAGPGLGLGLASGLGPGLASGQGLGLAPGQGLQLTYQGLCEGQTVANAGASLQVHPHTLSICKTNSHTLSIYLHNA